MKKNSFLEGTLIASIAIIFIKFLGAIYVAPLYKIIGETGGTIYSYAYNIYNLFLNISISGIPIAVSKIISEYNTLNMYNAKEKAYKISKNIMLILSLMTFFVMFVFSSEIASFILNNSNEGIKIIELSTAIKSISFCLLIIPFLSVAKGYLQGHEFIAPASYSQVLEQIVRIAIVLIGSYIVIYHLNGGISNGVNIALLGAFIGGIVSYLYLRIKIYKNRDKFINKEIDKTFVETKEIIKKIITYSIPLIIVSVATSIYDSTDLILVIRGLNIIGFDEASAQIVSSIIATWAPKICMIINAIAMGLSVNIIPHITSSYTKKDYKDVSEKIIQSIITIIFICIPMAIGIILLSDPIYTIFYGESKYGSQILKLSSIVAIFSSLHIVLNMILQGLNKYKVIYLNTIIGIIANVILDIPLIILFNKLNILPFYGAQIATIVGYLISFIIVFKMIKKEIKIDYKKIKNIIKKMIIPLFIMIITILGLNLIIPTPENKYLLCIIIAIYALIGSAIYFILTYINGSLNETIGNEYINKILKKFKIKKGETKKMKYFLKLITHLNFKSLKMVINEVHEKTGKSKIYIFFDIISLALLHGGGYYDYRIFRLYEYTNKERKTMVTRIRNKKLIMLLNDQKYSYKFDNKSVFNDIFKDYLKREYLILEKSKYKDFEKFMENKERIFAKPNSQESGKGIERLDKKDFKTLKEMWKYLTAKEKNFDLIEQEIIQHKALEKIYPPAINTLRIVTVVYNGVAHAAYCTLKTGNLGKYVDNMENDGLCAPVDMETGIVTGVGHTSKLINYDAHPYTGVKFVGYKIPYVKEAIEMAKKAALEVKEIGFVGWDVFIAPDGPGIIEGNDYPGYDFSQLPEHTPDHIGMWAYYKSIIKELK